MKYTGVWPNSSPNPNYAPVISRCPTPPANRTPYKLSTPPPRSRAVEEPPPPPPNCWSWRSGWAATIRIDRSVARHAISLPGDPGRAGQILEAVVADLPAGSLRAEALHQLVVVRVSGDSFASATGLLERGLAETGDDLSLRVQMLVTLSFAHFNAGQLLDAVNSVEQAVTAAALLGRADLLSQALGMRALLRFLYGDGFDVQSMQRALELEVREAPVPSVFRSSVHNALLLACTGELERAHFEMGAMRQHYLDRGEESELVFIDFHTVLVNIWRGDFTEAALFAEDLTERALQLGGNLPLCVGLTVRALLAAYLGRVDQARSDATEALAAGRRSGSRSLFRGQSQFWAFSTQRWATIRRH